MIVCKVRLPKIGFFFLYFCLKKWNFWKMSKPKTMISHNFSFPKLSQTIENNVKSTIYKKIKTFTIFTMAKNIVSLNCRKNMSFLENRYFMLFQWLSVIWRNMRKTYFTLYGIGRSGYVTYLTIPFFFALRRQIF